LRPGLAPGLGGLGVRAGGVEDCGQPGFWLGRGVAVWHQRSHGRIGRADGLRCSFGGLQRCWGVRPSGGDGGGPIKVFNADIKVMNADARR
jgi:hypothetical protein